MTSAQASAEQACPKCGKRRAAETDSCPRCGLIFALWSAEGTVAPTSLDDKGKELWQQVQDNWNDSTLHEQLLKHCLQTGTLAAVGRLYRDRLDENPKDAIAAQMQTQILAKATLQLAIVKTTPREAITRTKGFWAIVVVAMALGILGGLLWRFVR